MHPANAHDRPVLHGVTVLVRQPSGEVDCRGSDHLAISTVLERAGIPATTTPHWADPDRLLGVRIPATVGSDENRFLRVREVISARSSGLVAIFDFQYLGDEVEPLFVTGECAGEAVRTASEPVLVVVGHTDHEHRGWVFTDPGSFSELRSLLDRLAASYEVVEVAGSDHRFIFHRAPGRPLLVAIRTLRERGWAVRRVDSSHPRNDGAGADPRNRPLTALAISDCEPILLSESEFIEDNKTQIMMLGDMVTVVRRRFRDGTPPVTPDLMTPERAVPYLMELTEMLVRPLVQRRDDSSPGYELPEVIELLASAMSEAGRTPESVTSGIRLFREWMGLRPRTGHCDFPAAVDCAVAALTVAGADLETLKVAAQRVQREQLAIPRFPTQQPHPTSERGDEIITVAHSVVLVRHEDGHVHCHGTDYAKIHEILHNAGFDASRQADPTNSARTVDVFVAPTGQDDATLLERVHGALADDGNLAVVAYDCFYDLKGDGPGVEYAIAHETPGVMSDRPFLLMVSYSGETPATWLFTDRESLSTIRYDLEMGGTEHRAVVAEQPETTAGVAMSNGDDVTHLYRRLRGLGWRVKSLTFRPTEERVESDMSDEPLTPLAIEDSSGPDHADAEALSHLWSVEAELLRLVGAVRARFVDDLDPAASSRTPRAGDVVRLMTVTEMLLRCRYQRGTTPEPPMDLTELAVLLGDVVQEVYENPERAAAATRQFQEWMGLVPRTGLTDHPAAVDAVAAALFLIGSNDASELDDAVQQVAREHAAIPRLER